MEMLRAETVGEVIGDFRKTKRLSQVELSELAGIGRAHLSAIERGTRKPTLETFYRLCRALNIPMGVVTKEIEYRINEIAKTNETAKDDRANQIQ